MDLDSFYREVGGDYEKVLSRLPGEALIRKFVRKFPADPSFGELMRAHDARDVYAAFLAAHTLKGTAANLGLDALSEAASNLTEQLRHASQFPEEHYFTEVENAYTQTIDKIARLD